MKRYLQIDAAGTVIADTQPSGLIDDPACIPVAEDDPAGLGWTWDGQAFSPPEAD